MSLFYYNLCGFTLWFTRSCNATRNYCNFSWVFIIAGDLFEDTEWRCLGDTHLRRERAVETWQSETHKTRHQCYDSRRASDAPTHMADVMMLPHMITRACLPARQKAAWEPSRVRLFECGQVPEHRNSPRFAFGSGKCNNSSDIATGSENKCPLIELNWQMGGNLLITSFWDACGNLQRLTKLRQVTISSLWVSGEMFA